MVRRGVGSGELIVGPFYDAWRPGRWDAGLPPLVFAWKRNTATYLVTPIFYRQSDSARDYALNVFTLLYWGHEGKVARHDDEVRLQIAERQTRGRPTQSAITGGQAYVGACSVNQVRHAGSSSWAAAGLG